MGVCCIHICMHLSSTWTGGDCHICDNLVMESSVFGIMNSCIFKIKPDLHLASNACIDKSSGHNQSHTTSIQQLLPCHRAWQSSCPAAFKPDLKSIQSYNPLSSRDSRIPFQSWTLGTVSCTTLLRRSFALPMCRHSMIALRS